MGFGIKKAKCHLSLLIKTIKLDQRKLPIYILFFQTSTVGTSAATTLAPWKVKAEALKAKNAQRREEAMARLAEAKALLKLSPKERQQKRKEMADKRKAEVSHITKYHLKVQINE